MAQSRLPGDRERPKTYKVNSYLPADAKDKSKVINFYDKGINSVIDFIDFDTAVYSNDEKMILELLPHINKIIDDAIDAYVNEIKQTKHFKSDGEHIDIDAYNAYYAEKIKPILAAFNAYRLSEAGRMHLRQAYELLLVKLNIVLAQASGNINHLGKHEQELLATEFGDFSDLDRVHKVMPLPGSIGQFTINNLIPVYSTTGSVGFNTILYAIFNGYYYSGYSTKPIGVHAGSFAQNPIDTTGHDYGHNFNRIRSLQDKNPSAFAQYETVYHKIFTDKQRRGDQYSQKEFQSDLIILFLLVNEIGYYPEQNDSSVIKYIINHTKNGFMRNEKNEITPPQGMNAEEIQTFILEVIDFIEPLKQLGYVFPKAPKLEELSEDDKIQIEAQYWAECASCLQNALLDSLAGFAKRYPEVKLEPTINVEKEKTDIVMPSMMKATSGEVLIAATPAVDKPASHLHWIQQYLCDGQHGSASLSEEILSHGINSLPKPEDRLRLLGECYAFITSNLGVHYAMEPAKGFFAFLSKSGKDIANDHIKLLKDHLIGTLKECQRDVTLTALLDQPPIKDLIDHRRGTGLDANKQTDTRIEIEKLFKSSASKYNGRKR